ncbi:MAG: heparinase II/III-family protein [Defluviitaleaceae bacterium]|nr:heparinase II/III-family protein [Defluviitaleaceae bacterium]
MLTKKYNLKDVKKIGSFAPFPRYGDKEWKSIDFELAGKWISAGEKFLTYKWPALTADMYFTLGKTGQLKPHWDLFRERRSALGLLIFAECMEGKGRFIDQVINGIIATCEESSWIQPLGMAKKGFDIPNETDHEVDLTSSETASLLTWAFYLLGDAIDAKSKRIRERVKDVVSARVIKYYLDRDDYWWMGFTGDRTNNWNPWCNLNVIICLLIMEDDPDVRARGLYKVFRSLDAYVEAYSPDGCCDEGPMYWGAAGGGLFQCLEMLHEASGGAIDVFDNEKLKLIGQYITKTFIDDEYFVNYADGDAIAPISGTIYRYGKAIGDEGMMKLGAGAKRIEPRIFDWFQPYMFLHDFFREDIGTESGYYPAQSWLWKTGVMSAREFEGSAKGFFLSAKAGNNLESHNHNDIGNFVVYVNGKPLFIDIGTEEYSVKTFSSGRYEIWYIRSDYHNCIQVSGVDQLDGGDYYAQDVECVQNEASSLISMELKNAYPESAGIKSWKRDITLNRQSKSISITDDFNLDGLRPVSRFLVTPVKPIVTPDGIRFEMEDEIVLMRLSDECDIRIEEIPLTESRLCRNWGDMLYRIILHETVSQGMKTITIAH